MTTLEPRSTFSSSPGMLVVFREVLQRQEEDCGLERAMEACAAALTAACEFLAVRLGAEEAERAVAQSAAEYFSRIQRGRVQ